MRFVDVVIQSLSVYYSHQQANFYQSKIDEFEENHRDRFLRTDELLDNLKKMVMRLARSNVCWLLISVAIDNVKEK